MENHSKRVLLISNSTVYGGGFLDHAETEIRSFLGTTTEKTLFIPYALLDHDSYAVKVRERFAKMGYGLESIHNSSQAQKAVRDAQSIFIGGGNTFRLLNALYDLELLQVIRKKVEEGMPYIGSSAGSNVAGPTIRTTNDMPIVEPPSLTAIGLVTFQLNPHYLDPDPASTHMGETREDRIRQFHEENTTPVVGLREGTMLRIDKGSIVLIGSVPARIFRRGKDPIEVEPGTILNEIIS